MTWKTVCQALLVHCYLSCNSVTNVMARAVNLWLHVRQTSKQALVLEMLWNCFELFSKFTDAGSPGLFWIVLHVSSSWLVWTSIFGLSRFSSFSSDMTMHQPLTVRKPVFLTLIVVSNLARFQSLARRLQQREQQLAELARIERELQRQQQTTTEPQLVQADANIGGM